ncbi:beta-galactosidase 15-like protein [Cinnamomum micranthum f. kanehirae]|uniref:Beta-galactosidase n=1 Tax=Cinnamomum micranthum f. kanehirae TaxID=337451 RepID=A0A443NB30_9MAGN|nr:beta-galactosidase 15-like protein [Cinnamomum micranthum f. kanehirae]
MSFLLQRLLFSLSFLIFSSFCLATEVSYDGRALIIDGVRKVIISGSIHYPRSTAEMWPDLIQKAKEGGLNAIETYVFWDIHEPRRREYDFEGNRDIVRFFKTIQDAGLYAILRIGPYVCAEWNYGGFPVWLHQMPGIQLRTDNEIYENEMRNFTTYIVNKIKEANLLAPQGGPIILAQIENEYGNVEGAYGEAGKRYIKWVVQLAKSLNIGVPWIMCQQGDAPLPIINTCNGYYCDDFYPDHKIPKMWTENWVGWFKDWGGLDPHRPAEDVAYSVARFFSKSGTLQNYYMYHGGTNFGRTAGGPYIVTTYDYDAPLDEYGNLRQPKWGHLKKLHEILHSMEKVLTSGERSSVKLANGVWGTTYALNDTSGCFISNTDASNDFTVSFGGNLYFVPAWSVSILPDCKNVTYNTARITTQTEIMVKKPNRAENDPEDLTWLWLPEDIEDTLDGRGTFTVPELLEQKNVTGGASDYLWYMTKVRVSKHDPMYTKHMTLRVHTKGHMLHVFFNGKHVGSNNPDTQDWEYTLEVPVIVKPSINFITLLSTTVGLTNYGDHFDTIPEGIAGGPVELVGNGNLTRNLSTNPWTYKVDLNGMEKTYWDNDKLEWRYDGIPSRSRLTWYKAIFKAPLGDDPVVVNLRGLQKGEAWVNGNSLGRFWPTKMAPSECGKCDYRGPYNPNKCTTGCGEPTQSWYHVPRSFLEADGNSLIVFEEFGGSPFSVKFATVTVGTLCVTGYHGDIVELSCPKERPILNIEFANYGNATGTCGSYHKGANDIDISSLIESACVGKTSCHIDVSKTVIGHKPPCQGSKMVVQASC